MDRWMWVTWPAVGVVVGGLVSGWRFSIWWVLIFLCCCLVAWWVSPWSRGRSKTMSDVMALPDEDRRVVVYWRPGCPFCERLRVALGGRGDAAQWINIWQDSEAAAFVASVNGGNETVPTVVIDGEPHTNPDPRVVLEALAP